MDWVLPNLPCVVTYIHTLQAIWLQAFKIFENTT